MRNCKCGKSLNGFAENFFGLGNDTSYNKNQVELDFNRTRVSKTHAAISLNFRGQNGGHFKFSPLIESYEVENTEDRFVHNLPGPSLLFERQTYGGAELSYFFKNHDNLAFPTLGVDLGLTMGYKTNIDNSARMPKNILSRIGL